MDQNAVALCRLVVSCKYTVYQEFYLEIVLDAVHVLFFGEMTMRTVNTAIQIQSRFLIKQ